MPERLLATMGVPMMAPMLTRSAMVIVMAMMAMRVIMGAGVRSRQRGMPAIGRQAALDDLVEFAPVEPDAATLRAIVDLDPLALGHQQIGCAAHRTLHRITPI
jgi:hypothetical protein